MIKRKHFTSLKVAQYLRGCRDAVIGSFHPPINPELSAFYEDGRWSVDMGYALHHAVALDACRARTERRA